MLYTPDDVEKIQVPEISVLVEGSVEVHWSLLRHPLAHESEVVLVVLVVVYTQVPQLEMVPKVVVSQVPARTAVVQSSSVLHSHGFAVVVVVLVVVASYTQARQ